MCHYNSFPSIMFQFVSNVINNFARASVGFDIIMSESRELPTNFAHIIYLPISSLPISWLLSRSRLIIRLGLGSWSVSVLGKIIRLGLGSWSVSLRKKCSVFSIRKKSSKNIVVCYYACSGIFQKIL